ncbi:MAG: hypothetical protein HY866_05505 [Chloroflexi bacterium]|nr:hypothetical protein [Chloroflexota bacterium]
MAQQDLLSRIDLWAGRLNRLPRLGRVILSLLITLELVVLVSIVVDGLLIDEVVAGDVGAGMPILIEAVFGVIFYSLGWWALVGFDQPWRATTASVLYFAAGVIGLGLILILVLYGLAFGYLL